MHRQRRIVISTIGDLIEAGNTLRAYCERSQCWHGDVVDLEALAALVGRDYKIVEGGPRLRRRFRCRKCGHKGASFRIAPPTEPPDLSTWGGMPPGL